MIKQINVKEVVISQISITLANSENNKKITQRFYFVFKKIYVEEGMKLIFEQQQQQ